MSRCRGRVLRFRFLANQEVDRLSDILGSVVKERGGSLQDLFAQILSYSPMLQFVLIDEKRRIFVAQRYCFLGSIDDWIEIGKPGTLQKLVKTYVKHLGRDSYYELF